MMRQAAACDEFKVFAVADARPKDAWRAVVWLSRQPYSLVRRNCSDCAYDVLRAYGVPNLVGTAQENMPNIWYDALPGRNYPIASGTEVPLDLARATRLAHLRVREIPLHIPDRITAAPPPWRARGGQAWYEARKRARRLISRSWGYVASTFAHAPTADATDTASPADHGAPLAS